MNIQVRSRVKTLADNECNIPVGRWLMTLAENKYPSWKLIASISWFWMWKLEGGSSLITKADWWY